MLNIIFIEKIIVALINISGFFLGFWVYQSNKKEKLNQWFLVMTLFIILWVDYALLGNRVKNITWSLVFYRLNLGMVLLSLLSAFYFYIVYFIKNGYLLLRKILLTVGLILVGFSFFSPFIIRGVISRPWGNEIIFGTLNIVFNLYCAVIAFIIIGLLLKKYFHFSSTEKLQTQYFLIGTFLFAFCNIIFNIIIPSFANTVLYQHFGDYSAIFLLGFTAYAIVKQNLFGIKVVLTQIFVVLIWVLLLINFLTSQTTFEYFWKGAIFASFGLFGWLLIKSIMRDIKQKEQLSQYALDLERKNIELQSAYKRLETLDEAKSEFISIASHQLRTPLTAIKGYVSMFLEGDFGSFKKKARRALQNIFQANERLIALVNSLLDLSRLEAGKTKLEITKVDLKAMLKSLVADFSQKIKEKKIKISLESQPANIPLIEADEKKIREVFSNLIDNALKYTESGFVKIEIKLLHPLVRITVIDSGVGMSETEISELFQSFSRGESAKNMWVEGVGLGLYATRKFVEMHHGRIWAESEGRGRGSKFVVELPIAQNVQAASI